MVEFYSKIIVWIAVFCFALWNGGLATTIYNRVPNDIPIGPSHKPRCNNCGNEIKFKYFFPIFGYFLSKGRCIHCGVKISRIYLFIEISILCYILLLSITFDDFDERFISKSLYGAFLIVLLFIYQTYERIKSSLIFILVSFILAYKGYNHCLPSAIELFFIAVISCISFFHLQRIVRMDKTETIICIILTTSLGYIVSLLFLMLTIFIYIHHRLSLRLRTIQINNSHIVYITLLTALLMTFVK